MKAAIYFNGKRLGDVDEMSFEYSVEGQVPDAQMPLHAVSECAVEFDPAFLTALGDLALHQRPLTMQWESENGFGFRVGVEEIEPSSPTAEFHNEFGLTMLEKYPASIWCTHCQLGRLYSTWKALAGALPRWGRHQCRRGADRSSK